MGKLTGNILLIAIAMIIAAACALLAAFPIKWCWNYSVVHIWGWPAITWGQAWCLSFLFSAMIKPQTKL